MREDEAKPHLPGVDASAASDESVLRVHAQLRRRRLEASPVAFFAMTALIVVLVFTWFYARRHSAEWDSSTVLADRGQIKAMALFIEEGAAAEAIPLPADGGQLYAQQCVACHQANGAGLAGAFPPLDGASWVTGDSRVPIKILLHGLAGPIEVKGATYNGLMPAFGAVFDDEEIAALVTYIRTSWSNDASEVAEAEVAAVRAEIGERGSWTAAELLP